MLHILLAFTTTVPPMLQLYRQPTSSGVSSSRSLHQGAEVERYSHPLERELEPSRVPELG